MAIRMNLKDLSNPQYSAVTGRKSVNPYSAYLTAMGPSVRGDAFREKETLQGRKQFDLSQAFSREQMEIAKSQAKTATGISMASTGIAAAGVANQAGLINLKDVGSKLWPASAAPAAAPAGAAIAGNVGAGGAAAVGPSSLAGVTAESLAGVGPTGYVAPAGAGAAPVAGMLPYAGPAAAGFTVGQIVKGTHLGEWASERAPIGGNQEWNTGLGIAGGAAAGAAIGSVVPVVGTAIGAVVGGVAGGLGARCIIVTACTSPDSYEVEIARKYRDKFLDADQLRGYYALAERIVPLLERSEKARKNVKKWLVDRLIDYGAYHLGLEDTRPRWSSFVASRVFLGTIKIIGMILPRYVRSNGEVY